MSAGYGPDIQGAIVECALAFKFGIVVKRKFTLSTKSAIVASNRKLAISVARELATYGIGVQCVKSTRDVGIMFTAGVSRDVSLAKKRETKASLRTARISRVARVTRSARKLFTSGAYPQ